MNPKFVWQQNYQYYKPLLSQLIAQQGMEKDSNATVLMADEYTLKTLSPSQETNVKKMVLDGCGNWKTVHIAVQQDSLGCKLIHCTTNTHMLVILPLTEEGS